MANNLPMGAGPRRIRRPANNTTCDIYHAPNAPPSDADLEAIPCALLPDFRVGSEASEADQDFRWTHLLYVDASIDVRDNYPSAPTHTVYVPDKDGTKFEVVFVELVNRGTASEFKRVYLDRQLPTWPTNEL